MQGYFNLLAGNPQEARRLINAALAQSPNLVLAQAFLIQIDLVQDRKTEARQLAEQLAAANSRSPLALLNRGLVNIAYFNLSAAIKDFQAAIAINPRFLDAYIYLAKIWLGSDYLDRARERCRKGFTISPEQWRRAVFGRFHPPGFSGL